MTKALAVAFLVPALIASIVALTRPAPAPTPVPAPVPAPAPARLAVCALGTSCQ